MGIYRVPGGLLLVLMLAAMLGLFSSIRLLAQVDLDCDYTCEEPAK